MFNLVVDFFFVDKVSFFLMVVLFVEVVIIDWLLVMIIILRFLLVYNIVLLYKCMVINICLFMGILKFLFFDELLCIGFSFDNFFILFLLIYRVLFLMDVELDIL